MEINKYLNKVQQAFLSGNPHFDTITILITNWKNLLSKICHSQANDVEAYRALLHIKLSLKGYSKFKEPLQNDELRCFIEHLIKYVDVEIKCLSAPNNNKTKNVLAAHSMAEWTGGKRSLMELICALDSCKCLNNGNISTKELVGVFEGFFGLKLNNYHSEINKMSFRKPPENKDTKAYFLEKLATGFNAKLMSF